MVIDMEEYESIDSEDLKAKHGNDLEMAKVKAKMNRNLVDKMKDKNDKINLKEDLKNKFNRSMVK
jgi:hypothetical protein